MHFSFVLSLGMAVSAVTATGSFSQSCDDITLDGRILSANCRFIGEKRSLACKRDTHGRLSARCPEPLPNPTSIDLGKCLKNNGGVIQCLPTNPDLTGCDCALPVIGTGLPKTQLNCDCTTTSPDQKQTTSLDLEMQRESSPMGQEQTQKPEYIDPTTSYISDKPLKYTRRYPILLASACIYLYLVLSDPHLMACFTGEPGAPTEYPDDQHVQRCRQPDGQKLLREAS
ncbi:hypothetical protein LZ30DRAFT_799716 [Colletotrichum cereale]|nr:hypothetical protein LZ30DRAFT_799716 [Colletotrichum cereale]